MQGKRTHEPQRLMLQRHCLSEQWHHSYIMFTYTAAGLTQNWSVRQRNTSPQLHSNRAWSPLIGQFLQQCSLGLVVVSWSDSVRHLCFFSTFHQGTSCLWLYLYGMSLWCHLNVMPSSGSLSCSHTHTHTHTHTLIIRCCVNVIMPVWTLTPPVQKVAVMCL